jgi:hypothetical protein
VQIWGFVSSFIHGNVLQNSGGDGELGMSENGQKIGGKDGDKIFSSRRETREAARGGALLLDKVCMYVHTYLREKTVGAPTWSTVDVSLPLPLLGTRALK